MAAVRFKLFVSLLFLILVSSSIGLYIKNDCRQFDYTVQEAPFELQLVDEGKDESGQGGDYKDYDKSKDKKSPTSTPTARPTPKPTPVPIVTPTPTIKPTPTTPVTQEPTQPPTTQPTPFSSSPTSKPTTTPQETPTQTQEPNHNTPSPSPVTPEVTATPTLTLTPTKTPTFAPTIQPPSVTIDPNDISKIDLLPTALTITEIIAGTLIATVLLKKKQESTEDLDFH